MPLLLIAISIGATIVGVVAVMDQRMQRRIDAEVAALFADLPAGRQAAIDGVRVPTQARVSWVPESGEFTYWEARLTELEHDRPRRY